jgi:hypothetical protein
LSFGIFTVEDQIHSTKLSLKRNMVGGRKPKIQRKRVYKTVPLDGAGDEPTEDQAGGEVGGRQRRRPSEERTESPQPPTASASGRGRGRRPSATSSSQRGRLEEPPLKQKDDGDDDDDDNKDLVDDDVEDTGDTGERLSDDDGDDSLQMGDDDGDELPGANADVDGLARFTDNDDADVEYERLVAKKEARRQKFEQEKRSILDQLPASYLETFGEVGFGKFGAKYFPVMILGPYDVPSGPPSNLRDKWTAAFETVCAVLDEKAIPTSAGSGAPLLLTMCSLSSCTPHSPLLADETTGSFGAYPHRSHCVLVRSGAEPSVRHHHTKRVCFIQRGRSEGAP